jgi:hypothetical protein
MSDASAPRFRSGWYIAIVVIAAVMAYAHSLRQDGIFACPGGGYGPDSFLAYCDADQYGDYDHGAMWFNLESAMNRSLAGTDVLFLGNSRMQFGFSSDATNGWFERINAHPFLMGFAYWENYQFEWPLLKRFTPKPKAYVINMDLFFGTVVSGPAASVMRDTDAKSHYQRKRLWQLAHQIVCADGSAVCGAKEAFYRSMATGEYVRKGGERGHFPVSYATGVDRKLVDDYVKRGREFIAALPADHRCIIVTLVPSKDTAVATTQAIADALGLTMIAPRIDDLTMFDHSHLDRPSAERWSKAFFEAAGPTLQACLAHGAANPGTT